MIKILYVSPVLPLRMTAGNVVHTHSIINLFKINSSEIDFIYYGNKDIYIDKNEKLNGLYQVRNNIKEVYKDYLYIDEWMSDELLNCVNDISKYKKYDIVVVDYVWMSKILEIPMLKKCKKYIVAHDIFANRQELFKKINIKKSWFYTNEYEEKKGLNRCDAIIAITENDKKYYNKIINKPCYVYYDFNQKRLSNFTEKNKYILGYIASDNPLNKYSINELLKNIPNKKYNNFEIEVGGAISAHIDNNFLKINKNGFVKSIDDFYNKCDIMLLPMCDSTGLKMKTLEAIAYGKPFIATKNATDGIQVSAHEHSFDSIKAMGNWLGNFSDHKFISQCGRNLMKETNKLSEKISAISFSNSCEIITDIFKNSAINPYKYKISVVIPCYNSESTVKRCIDSILEDRLKDVEIIVVDDASTDHTTDVLWNYNHLENIKIIKLQENVGQGPARSAGLDYVEGEYIYFIDSDDYIKKDSLFYLYQKADQLKLDLCSIKRNYLTTRPIEYISSFPSMMGIIRSSIIQNHMLTQPSIRSGQDGIFSNMILNYCKKIGVAEEADYIYIKRKDSTFNRYTNNISLLIPIVEEHLYTLRNYYKNNNLNLDRYLLFIYDETYKLRFLKSLKISNLNSSKLLYNIIKCEIGILMDKISKNAISFTDKNFRDINVYNFEQWVEIHNNLILR